MARLSLAAVLALAFAPNALAVEKTVALEGLKQIAELKSMDMDVSLSACSAIAHHHTSPTPAILSTANAEAHASMHAPCPHTAEKTFASRCLHASYHPSLHAGWPIPPLKYEQPYHVPPPPLHPTWSSLSPPHPPTSQDVICDECLEEIDCIWPCELACVLNVPEAFAGKVCQVCLEYFGCEGCKFMCPTPDTDAPSLFPSEVPTVAPTLTPSAEPTYGPTATPAKVPTPTPTTGPTSKPTVSPTAAPQADPTHYPTYAPSGAPTTAPSVDPTTSPTYEPTGAPTLNPTTWPSPYPTYFPTSAPTGAPSVVPTAAPTIPPTGAPSVTPDFYVYYTVEDQYLYAYNVIQDTTELYAEANFTGDLKIDSPNKFMFWSDPQKGHIIKQVSEGHTHHSPASRHTFPIIRMRQRNIIIPRRPISPLPLASQMRPPHRHSPPLLRT